jgi:hypothetical protein
LIQNIIILSKDDIVALNDTDEGDGQHCARDSYRPILTVDSEYHYPQQR